MPTLTIYKDCFYYSSLTTSSILKIGFDKVISEVSSLPLEKDPLSSHNEVYGIVGMFTSHLLVITCEVPVGVLFEKAIFRCDKILALPFDSVLANEILDDDISRRPSFAGSETERDPCTIPLPPSPTEDNTPTQDNQSTGVFGMFSASVGSFGSFLKGTGERLKGSIESFKAIGIEEQTTAGSVKRPPFMQANSSLGILKDASKGVADHAKRIIHSTADNVSGHNSGMLQVCNER
jgi:hypothetical protein